jgi:L-ribulose-5-phosphate 4-epimerase
VSGAWLLGLDAGGGSVRALLLDAESGAVHTAGRPWIHRRVPGTGGLGVELDTGATWASLAAATREVIAAAGAAPAAIAGVSVCAMRYGLVVVDGSGAAIHAVTNADGRGSGAALRLALERGAELHARAGHWPMAVAAGPRLRALADADPRRAARAARALALSDWIAWRLCDEMATDPAQASNTGVFDVKAGTWSPELADAVGVDRALFPPVVASGTRLGGLGAEAAATLGLRTGTPVAVGGADTQCALLGMGAIEVGDVGLVGGTTVPLQLVLAEPRLDGEGRLWTECHAVPGRWVLESNAGSLGTGLEWVAGLLFPDAAHPIRRLLAEAARSEAGARGTLATLGPPQMDGRAMSIPVGHASFSPLVAHEGSERRRHLARAFVEASAHTLRANLEQLRAAAGPGRGPIRAAGGLARSETWLRITGDVIGEPIGVARTPEASALGAALCAGVGAGLWPDFAAAVRDGPHEQSIDPDPERASTYTALHSRWRRLAAARSAADAVAAEGLMAEVLGSAEGTTARLPNHRPRILVTADLDQGALARLESLGEVEFASFRETPRLLAGPSLVEALQGVAVFVTEVDVVDAASLAKLPELRVIATCRNDAVNVDVEACSAHGIPVLHTPGRNAEAVADLTVAFALMLARKLPAATAFLRQPGIEAGDMGRMGQAFGSLRGLELGGRTIGLVGLGAVGRAVARRLRAFGARVLASDPFVSAEQAALSDVEVVPLDALLAGSDIVSLHAPVSEATRGLVGARELGLMKAGAMLINTARAALVDEDALLEALASGRLGGAALDVFAVEPPGSDHPLLQHEAVIATPHVGGNTAEVSIHQGRIVADDLGRLMRGERPRHVLDPETLEAFDWEAPRPEPDPARLAALAERSAPAVSDLQRDAKRRPPPAAAASAAAPSPAAPRPAAPREVVEIMERILHRFVEQACDDAALAAFAADQDVTLHFTLSDLGLAFWLRLRGGVSGGLGAPDAEPEVGLKLVADVLDGMFTGRVNGMQAAMEGRLSFTGDAGKAMTLQQMQRDLSRLYRAVRTEVGDPGDLSALAAPAAGAAPETLASDDVRPELIRAVNELYSQQLITATGGNVSARIPGRDELWITPSQLFKGDLRPEILVRIDLDGRSLDEGARAASSERLMHCAVYRARPEAAAVVHAHAPHATILANAGLPFLPISTEAAFFGDIPRVPFIMPGTKALADAVEEAARESWAVLMVNHGLLVAGRSLRRAADMVEIVERSAELILGCYAVGREPPTLPEDVVATLRKMGDLVA